MSVIASVIAAIFAVGGVFMGIAASSKPGSEFLQGVGQAMASLFRAWAGIMEAAGKPFNQVLLRFQQTKKSKLDDWDVNMRPAVSAYLRSETAMGDEDAVVEKLERQLDRALGRARPPARCGANQDVIRRREAARRKMETFPCKHVYTDSPFCEKCGELDVS